MLPTLLAVPGCSLLVTPAALKADTGKAALIYELAKDTNISFLFMYVCMYMYVPFISRVNEIGVVVDTLHPCVVTGMYKYNHHYKISNLYVCRGKIEWKPQRG